MESLKQTHIFNLVSPWSVFIHIECCDKLGLPAALLRKIPKKKRMGPENED